MIGSRPADGSDDQIRYSNGSFGCNGGAIDINGSAFILQGGPCAHDGTVVVQNNTFAFAGGALLMVDQYTEEYSRVLKDNTYVRNPDGAGVDIVWTEENYSLERGASLLGDTGAVVIGR